MDYRIEPLTAERLDDYIKPCWVPGEELEEGARLKKELIRGQLDQGFIGRILYVEGNPVGIAEALPIEIAPFKLAGERTAVLHCIRVKPDWQGRGLGRALIEEVHRSIHPQALAVFGFDYAGFMPAEFFTHLGFVELEERDNIKLLYLPPEDTPTEEPPRIRWLPRNHKPVLRPGKLVVEVFVDNHCPYASLIATRVISVAGELDPGRIEVLVHDVSLREDTLRLGKSLGVFANGEELFIGPLPRDEVLEILKDKLDELGF
ncbi:GNAT family N-acetyltransferase [bacterium]|nr:GNAT family N-acetyltransferase [bacterium]